jgi:hypothetical protein
MARLEGERGSVTPSLARVGMNMLDSCIAELQPSDLGACMGYGPVSKLDCWIAHEDELFRDGVSFAFWV